METIVAIIINTYIADVYNCENKFSVGKSFVALSRPDQPQTFQNNIIVGVLITHSVAWNMHTFQLR